TAVVRRVRPVVIDSFQRFRSSRVNAAPSNESVKATDAMPFSCHIDTTRAVSAIADVFGVIAAGMHLAKDRIETVLGKAVSGAGLDAHTATALSAATNQVGGSHDSLLATAAEHWIAADKPAEVFTVAGFNAASKSEDHESAEDNSGEVYEKWVCWFRVDFSHLASLAGNLVRAAFEAQFVGGPFCLYESEVI